ncbi:MAG: hypothetical protein HFI76_05675 [Lachnospiraceae bacterium]|nr:hypothetical protein [Lachnospiraceae bacterium]
MQPYQEEYIKNLKELFTLTGGRNIGCRTYEEFLRDLSDSRVQAVEMVKRNMQLLRDGLFPILDHMFEAEEEELKGLEEFAGCLLDTNEELDVGLFCQIHRALLSLARQTKDRNGMIRELYWLGIGYYHWCNKLIGLKPEESEAYTTQMRLCFTEAAAYLKYFDEIEDAETRGYILRSRANMALGNFKVPGEKIRMVKRSLEIIQDAEYQKIEPSLPWERYVYMIHQQMASSISYTKEESMTPQDVADIMDSVYIVYERQLQEAAEKKTRPSIRVQFSYYAIEYYCGLDTLNGLLTKMERLMDQTDPEDFSWDNMYGMISLPAFYSQFLEQYPEKMPERTEYLESIYRKVLDYLGSFPREAEKEMMFFYLRQLSCTFLETEQGTSYKEFLMKLQMRFAPVIYVHSWVVGKAAVEFCRIIMEEEPDFFDDIDHIRGLSQREEKEKAVLVYAMECGMLHDTGKMDFVNLYAKTVRQWFEEEYELAHLHTISGEAYLAARSSTADYAAVALGHHLWYDGSLGYPKTYHRLECQYRQMVDVIGLVDWLDNVTNANFFHTGVEKNFKEAVGEAIDLEGRRFSPLLTARLREKKVAERLEKAFVEGRREAYRRLYDERASV